MLRIDLTENETHLLKELIQWSETFSTDDEEDDAALQALYVKLKIMLA